MKKILLVDGHNLLFKMFYGMQFVFYNDNNKNITASVGFVGRVANLLKRTCADECLVVFDSETSLKARQDENYKANRIVDYSNASEEDNPFAQLSIIKNVLDYLKINWIEVDNYECDDYIAMFSKNYHGEVFISSTDTDFYQLINNTTKIVELKNNKLKIIDENYIADKFNVLPNQFALYKSLVGDKADNIKGIYGVGTKTAVKIIESVQQKLDNKYKKIYDDNIEKIKHNLSLIVLPNEKMYLSEINFQTHPAPMFPQNFKHYNIVKNISQTKLL